MALLLSAPSDSARRRAVRHLAPARLAVRIALVSAGADWRVIVPLALLLLVALVLLPSATADRPMRRARSRSSRNRRTASGSPKTDRCSTSRSRTRTWRSSTSSIKPTPPTGRLSANGGEPPVAARGNRRGRLAGSGAGRVRGTRRLCEAPPTRSRRPLRRARQGDRLPAACRQSRAGDLRPRPDSRRREPDAGVVERRFRRSALFGRALREQARLAARPLREGARRHGRPQPPASAGPPSHLSATATVFA